MYVGRRKDGMLECYYRALGAQVKEAIGYAVSRDGIHWEKPILKLVESSGGKDNNLVPCSPPVDLGQYGNVSDPTKRFVVTPGQPKLPRLSLGLWEIEFPIPSRSKWVDMLNNCDRERWRRTGSGGPARKWQVSTIKNICGF